MKYNLEIRAVALQSQSIEEKHNAFLSGLVGIPAPWGIDQVRPAPDPGSGLSATLKVAKLFGKGLRGDLVYQFRRPFRDDASQDDYLNMVFDPGKVNYQELVYTVLLRYVVAFGGYYAEISDDEFIFMDFDQRRQMGVDKRHAVYRIPPVCYLHRDLCIRALGMSPEKVVAQLKGKVEDVQEIHDGVFIVLTSKVLPTAEMDTLCWEAKSYLC